MHLRHLWGGGGGIPQNPGFLGQKKLKKEKIRTVCRDFQETNQN